MDETAYDRALEVMLEFRAEHREPLTKANMGLRSMVAAEACEVEVSQRLKRVPTILDKLKREPTLALARMQDVGGCRAILPTIADIRRVQRRVVKRDEMRARRGPSGQRLPKRQYDYITTPRASGYRGVHVIVQYDGRNIEVQLRTRVMHEWAFTVERLSGRLAADLKAGGGPKPVLAWLTAISRAMAIEESGEVVDSALVSRIGRLRETALPYLTGGRP